MSTTHHLEKGRIVAGGAGGFLNPPTHPEHTHHVETDLRRKPEDRGSASLSYARDCAYLDPATRQAARAMLDQWIAPPIDSEPIVVWRRQVLGYFRSCYRNPANDMDHAGVQLIRTFYPLYVPTAEDFALARWGGSKV